MDNYNATQEHEFGWDDEITQDVQEFTILPEGDYPFVIKKVVKERFNGSEKMPACPRATITLGIPYQGQEISVQHSLLLHSKVEWRLSEFFTSIGVKKEGEPLKMKWNIEGFKGKCKIGTRTYNNNTYNDVKKFYKPEAQNAPKQNWNQQGW